MEEHKERNDRGWDKEKINIDQAERLSGLMQREREEDKEGGGEEKKMKLQRNYMA